MILFCILYFFFYFYFFHSQFCTITRTSCTVLCGTSQNPHGTSTRAHAPHSQPKGLGQIDSRPVRALELTANYAKLPLLRARHLHPRTSSTSPFFNISPPPLDFRPIVLSGHRPSASLSPSHHTPSSIVSSSIGFDGWHPCVPSASPALEASHAQSQSQLTVRRQLLVTISRCFSPIMSSLSPEQYATQQSQSPSEGGTAMNLDILKNLTEKRSTRGMSP